MNQAELLDVTDHGETLYRFADANGLDQVQLESLAQFATAPHMTCDVVIDRQRVVFVHGGCPHHLALHAVNMLPINPTGLFKFEGLRLRAARSPIGEMYTVFTLMKVVPE